MGQRAIIVFAHGSSVAEANHAVWRAAREMAALGGFEQVSVAFLDCTHPDLKQAVSGLAAGGFRDFLVVPYFLTLGTHLQRDLPRLVGEILAEWPGLHIEVTPPLDGHPALARVLVERVREAEAGKESSEGASARVA